MSNRDSITKTTQKKIPLILSIRGKFLICCFLDDVSICVAFNKKNNDKITLTDTLQYTNLNELNVYENCPAELIEFFDPSIEYLKVDVGRKKTDIRLKFKKEDEIILSRTSELNRYLSSGTIKGINIFIYPSGL